MKKKKHQPVKQMIQHTQVQVQKNNLYIPGIIAAAVAFILYLNTLGNNYALDDFSSVKDNTIVEKGFSGIPELLTTHYRHGFWGQKSLYRPLSLVTFAIEQQFFPDKPLVYHLINVLLYALTVFLIFDVMRMLMKSDNIIIPFLCALLYASHPIHTEAVANIKSRDEILSFLFSLLAIKALWSYHTSQSKPRLILSLILFLFAMLAKESAITLLAVIPLMLFFFSSRSPLQITKTTLLFVIPLIPYLMLRYKALDDIISNTDVILLGNFLVAAPDLAGRIATATQIMGNYLWLLIFPHPLVYDYSYNQIPIVRWNDAKALLSLLIHAGLLVFALKNLKKKDLITFGILFYFITMSIYSNIFIIIGAGMGERFLYAPSTGFCIVMAILICKIFKTKINSVAENSTLSSMIKNNRKMFVVITIILTAYSIKTVSRNKDWKDNFTLFSHDLKNASNSCNAHRFYGMQLLNKHDGEKDINQKINYLAVAINEFKTAINIYPDYVVAKNNIAVAYENLGRIYLKNGQPDMAIQNYNESVKYNADNAVTWSNFGTAYFNKADYQKAIELFKKSIEKDSSFIDAYLNLGSSYGSTGNYAEAILWFQNGLKHAPNNAGLYYNLAISHQNAGGNEKAQIYFNKAYELNPSLKQPD